MHCMSNALHTIERNDLEPSHLSTGGFLYSCRPIREIVMVASCTPQKGITGTKRQNGSRILRVNVGCLVDAMELKIFFHRSVTKSY